MCDARPPKPLKDFYQGRGHTGTNGTRRAAKGRSTQSDQELLTTGAMIALAGVALGMMAQQGNGQRTTPDPLETMIDLAPRELQQGVRMFAQLFS